LGFDPLYIANEGKLIVIVPEAEVEAVLSAMKNTKYGKNCCLIGEVVEKYAGRVFMKTTLGTTRILDMMAGEMLPRIC
jgi:hydrogenase expression/formation protein HypE